MQLLHIIILFIVNLNCIFKDIADRKLMHKKSYNHD